MPAHIKLRYSKLYIYLSILMKRIGLTRYKRFIKFFNYRRNPFSQTDYDFFDLFIHKKHKNLKIFNKIFSRYIHEVTRKAVYTKLAFKHVRKVLDAKNVELIFQQNLDEETLVDILSQKTKFLLAFLSALAEKYFGEGPEESVPAGTDFRSPVRERMPAEGAMRKEKQRRSLGRKVWGNGKPVLGVLTEASYEPSTSQNDPRELIEDTMRRRSYLDEAYDEYFKNKPKIEYPKKWSIFAVEELKASPFIDSNKEVKRFLRITTRGKKYKNFNYRRKNSFWAPGDIRKGVISFINSSILYHSLRMDRFLTCHSRHLKHQKWRFAFQKTTSQLNPFDDRKQVYPGKLVKIRKFGMLMKEIFLILCFKNNGEFYEWGGKVKLDSIRFFNAKTRRVIKVVEMSDFENEEWYSCGAHFSADFDGRGHLIFRMFIRSEVYTVDLDHPQKSQIRLRATPKQEKRFSSTITSRSIVSTSASQGRFSIHFRKGRKDFVRVYKPNSKHRISENKSFLFSQGDFKNERLYCHAVLFNLFVLFVTTNHLIVYDTKTGQRVSYEFEYDAPEGFEEGLRGGGEVVKRKFWLDLWRKVVFLKASFKGLKREFVGVLRLDGVFEDIYEKVPGLRRKMWLL